MRRSAGGTRGTRTSPSWPEVNRLLGFEAVQARLKKLLAEVELHKSMLTEGNRKRPGATSL